MKAILARKLQMTTFIDPETAEAIPVTLLEGADAEVLQIKTIDKEGYSAAVLGAFPKNKQKKNINKNFGLVCEVTVANENDIKKGSRIGPELLEGVSNVKISGTSKGKGFAGVIKRYGFSRGPETHGSHHHREPGSVGMCAKPARIIKGKKMPGRMGTDQITLRSVSVIKIDLKNNLIALKGPVPGAKNSYIIIQEA